MGRDRADRDRRRLRIAVVLLGARGPAWGVVAVGLFAALAALTYLSIAWSVQPADSWVEANRTLSYLAAFGAAVALARLAPARWPALVGAVAGVAVVTCGYALLAKVFPATINAQDHLGRLQVPFSYWNATGLMAALGLPACLWAGARAEASRWVRALTVPAIALLVTVLMLSYSRGALIAGVVGLAVWFVLVPMRLRATLLLATGGDRRRGGECVGDQAQRDHRRQHRARRPHERRARVRGGPRRGDRDHGDRRPDRRLRTRADRGGGVRTPANRHRADRVRRAGPGRRGRRHGRVLARTDRRDLARLDDAHQHEQRPAPATTRRASPRSATAGRCTGARGSRSESTRCSPASAPAASTPRTPATARARSRSPTLTAT